jgi:hypothetical protein
VSPTPPHNDQWPWPDDLDACIAAPASHHVLFENDAVRVLEVIIEPGTREPLHTHRTPSVMIVDRPARIRYCHRGALTYETPGAAVEETRTSWLDPEPPHSVEHVDVHRYHAFRIELRRAARRRSILDVLLPERCPAKINFLKALDRPLPVEGA